MSSYTLSAEARKVIEDMIESLPALPGISIGSFMVAADSIGVHHESSMGRTIFKKDDNFFWIPDDKISYSRIIRLTENGMGITTRLRVPYEGYESDNPLYNELVDIILSRAGLTRETIELPLASALIVPALPFLVTGTVCIVTNEEFEAAGLPDSCRHKRPQDVSFDI